MFCSSAYHVSVARLLKSRVFDTVEEGTTDTLVTMSTDAALELVRFSRSLYPRLGITVVVGDVRLSVPLGRVSTSEALPIILPLASCTIPPLT